MNNNYRKCLINEMFDRNILNSEEERAEVKELMNALDEEERFTGNFDEDVEMLTEAWNDSLEEETSPEEEVDEILNNLHVGFNVIPGLGVCYSANEEDLAAMKAWLRDRMLAATLLAKIFRDE